MPLLNSTKKIVFHPEYNVVVLGSGGVGKSALTSQVVSHTFPERYDPTIEDFFRLDIEVDDAPAVLEILDTASAEHFGSMREANIKNGQGFIFVYSVTDRQTLQELQPIREQVIRLKGRENIPVILVGNKIDVADARDVTMEEGQKVADAWGCSFFETSAKTCDNVGNAFAEIVKLINTVYCYPKQKKKKRRKKKYCCIA